MRIAILATLTVSALSRPALAQFTLEQARSYPYPTELTAAPSGSRIAWAFNERGRRNIYVAEGPTFGARQLTHYDRDDGQELSSVAVSANGRWVVYVRGGDHGSNWDDALPVNVGSNPVPPKVQIFSVPFDGGDPKPIGDGDEPVVSPRSDVVAFIKGGQIWVALLARWLAARVRDEPRRSLLHWGVHERQHADHVSRAVVRAGSLAALVPRRAADRVRQIAGRGRCARFLAAAATQSVGNL